MGEKLSKAPVYFTIVQVRFNAIPRMDTFAPNIQEKFRKASFSDAQTNTLSTLNLSFGMSDGVGQQPIPLRQQTQHTYSNFESKACFILDQSSLTFQTTEYDTFESFSETFLMGLGLVNEGVEGIDFVDRIGFRYLNAFKARDNESITTYLNAKVVGLFSEVEIQTSHSFTETVYVRNKKNILARTIILNGRFSFPLDVQPGALKVADRFTKISDTHGALDIDGSTMERQKFNMASVATELKLVHDEIEVAFTKIVSPHALEVWK